MAGLTVEWHNVSNNLIPRVSLLTASDKIKMRDPGNEVAFPTVLFYKRTTHEPSRTTLALSSLFCVGKILIYVNTDYHKLHLPVSDHVSSETQDCIK